MLGPTAAGGKGRGLEPTDFSAVRQVVRGAAASNYKFSSIVEGLVKSTPFRMRDVPAKAAPASTVAAAQQ